MDDEERSIVQCTLVIISRAGDETVKDCERGGAKRRRVSIENEIQKWPPQV